MVCRPSLRPNRLPVIDILTLMGGLGVGGTERHLSLILPELARRGWRVEVALLADDGPFGDPLHAAGIAVRQVDCGRILPISKLRGLSILLGQARTLAHRLRTAPPRLLHCFLPSCCIVGSWAAGAAQFMPVIMSRRSQAKRPELFLGDKWLERRALRRANLVFGHSQWVLSELGAERIPLERLRLIHNGIPLTQPTSLGDRVAARQMAGWGEDEVVIVAVANLIPYKGHADLLHALAYTTTAIPWRLILIGGGSAAAIDALRTMAASLSLGARVSILGQRDDVPKLLAGADIGVLASHHEGFSNAVLEYMAAGLPVVATATGGNLDAVEDGQTGLLIPVAEPLALATALTTLLEDASLRRRMGKAGRTRAEAKFSLEACVDAYEAAYRQVLGAPCSAKRGS